MAVAKVAHEFIICFKNVENYFNSPIIVMKTWGEDAHVERREGWWDSRRGKDGQGRGFIRHNSPKQAFVR